jgi:hypothetical protein
MVVVLCDASLQVGREYYPERFGFELFGDPFEKKRLVLLTLLGVFLSAFPMFVPSLSW